MKNHAKPRPSAAAKALVLRPDCAALSFQLSGFSFQPLFIMSKNWRLLVASSLGRRRPRLAQANNTTFRCNFKCLHSIICKYFFAGAIAPPTESPPQTDWRRLIPRRRPFLPKLFVQNEGVGRLGLAGIGQRHPKFWRALGRIGADLPLFSIRNILAAMITNEMDVEGQK
jgi:hypothetical protein